MAANPYHLRCERRFRLGLAVLAACSASGRDATSLPVAARFLSSYATAGIARESHEWRFVTEAGLKFRVTVHGWQRVLSLGYQFAGLRLGVRSSGFDALEDVRFVVEIGAGVW